LAVFGSVALGWSPVGELLFIKSASRLFFQDKILASAKQIRDKQQYVKLKLKKGTRLWQQEL